MKAKLLFQWLTRSLLVIVIMGSFLVIPNQAASAKPLSAVFTNCASQIEIPQTECDALVALYNATDGENWTDNTGWLTTDTPCSWDGVGCSSGTNVTNLSLGWNYLSGTIPPELGNLTNLTQLFLDGNQLSGSIPTELGNLTKLTYLDLSSNDQLNGSIPTELGNLTKLTQLFLDGNQLSGAIPPELGSLTNLISLYLSDNQLSGSIPVELGSLIQLQSLYLRGNQISGEFPASITNLTNLQSFEFDQCAGLTSSNPAVIAFLNQKAPNWTVCDQDMSIQLKDSAIVIPSGDTTPSLAEGTDLGGISIGKECIFKFEIWNNGSISELWLTGNPIVTISGSPSFTINDQPVPWWSGWAVEAGDSANFSIRFAPTSLGLHTATISIANNEADKNPYTFTVQGVGAKSDAYEDDDNFLTARTIVAGVAQNHSIFAAGDHDYVKFTLASPSSLSLETSGPDGYDTEIALYDASYNLIGYDSDSGDFLYSRLTRACNNPLPAGNYYLMVYAYDGVIPEYQLRFDLNESSCPMVSSITRVSGATTNLSSVDFTVTFSEPVIGIDTNDFKLTNTLLTGASVTGVTDTSPYTVTVNTGTGNGTIRLDVAATATIQDLDGNPLVGPYTDGQIYTVEKGTAPTVPVLVSPSNGALVTGYKPTLDWNDSSPVMALANNWSYEINVTDAPLGTYNQTFNTASGLENSFYTFTSPLTASSTFSWKVRAYNDNNQYSAWSTTRTFNTGSKLDTPILRLPADLAPENNKRPTFSWDAMPGAATYTLQILKGTAVAVTGTIKAPAHIYTPTADLLPSTTYTWKVKANNGVNSGDYSMPFTFTTSANPPKVPLLSTPKNASLIDSALTQILTWSPVLAVTSPASPPALSYEIQYATNSAFNNPRVTAVSDAQISLPGYTLLPNTTYYWQVRSWSGAGAIDNHSAWSLVRTFRTKLSTPILNLPANSALLDNKRPTFSWDEVPGATSYTLQILKAGKAVVTGTIKIPAYTFTPTADLLPGIIYTWKVKANGVNAGDYSDSFTFTTSSNPPKVPVLSAPKNGILVDSTAAQTLKWTPVLGVSTTSATTTYPPAASYEVEYAANALFTNSLIVKVSDPQTSPITLFPGRTYYWHVRSWSDSSATGNHSAWSLTRMIKVKFIAPTLTAPSSDATGVGVRPTFTWTSANGLWTSYTLQVAPTNAFGKGTRSFTIKAPFTTYTIPDSLPALTAGNTYFWRVKINGLYTPIPSAAWSFKP